MQDLTNPLDNALTEMMKLCAMGKRPRPAIPLLELFSTSHCRGFLFLADLACDGRRLRRGAAGAGGGGVAWGVAAAAKRLNLPRQPEQLLRDFAPAQHPGGPHPRSLRGQPGQGDGQSGGDAELSGKGDNIYHRIMKEDDADNNWRI